MVFSLSARRSIIDRQKLFSQAIFEFNKGQRSESTAITQCVRHSSRVNIDLTTITCE